MEEESKQRKITIKRMVGENPYAVILQERDEITILCQLSTLEEAREYARMLALAHHCEYEKETGEYLAEILEKVKETEKIS